MTNNRNNSTNKKKFPWLYIGIGSFVFLLVVAGATAGIILYLRKLKADKKKEEQEQEIEDNETRSEENENILIPNQPLNHKEVFNTGNKIWSQEQASDVCKSFNAELATYDQLLDAAKNGAHWCNQGWFKEQVYVNKNQNNELIHSGFPVQKDIYHNYKLENECGLKLNPEFENEPYSIQNLGITDNYKLSVNCYGQKPKQTLKNYEKDILERKQKEKRYSDRNNEVNKIIKEKNIDVLPFNNTNWSSLDLIV